MATRPKTHDGTTSIYSYISAHVFARTKWYAVCHSWRCSFSFRIGIGACGRVIHHPKPNMVTHVPWSFFVAVSAHGSPSNPFAFSSFRISFIRTNQTKYSFCCPSTLSPATTASTADGTKNCSHSFELVIDWHTNDQIRRKSKGMRWRWLWPLNAGASTSWCGIL